MGPLLRAEVKKEADADDDSLLAHLKSSHHEKFRKYGLHIHKSWQISIGPLLKRFPSQRTIEGTQVIQMNALGMQSTASHRRPRDNSCGFSSVLRGASSALAAGELVAGSDDGGGRESWCLCHEGLCQESNVG